MRNILHYLGKIHDSRKKEGIRYKIKSILSLILLGYTGIHQVARALRVFIDLENN